MSKALDPEFGPWNPGINSTIPSRLMARATLFDPRHSFVNWDEANELSAAIGLKPQELAVTRPERLALHSVLIRVTSQLYVSDGPNYADLGIRLRTMAREILDGFVMPALGEIETEYASVQREAEQTIEDLLKTEIFTEPQAVDEPNTGFLGRIFSKQAPAPPPPDPAKRALEFATAWRDAHNEDIDMASRRAVARVLGAVLNQRGALHVDRDTLARVAVGLVMNRLGSAAVGETVQALFEEAVDALGYRRLPPQEHPVVINVKGASAAGKSSIRGEQRKIAERAGYDWQDFAIISPDYWRKALIDYNGFGKDHKYVAMLCGQELEVIDRKLDILMAVKGADGTVPHMLIDRFRFDSFQADRARAEDSTLLTRFGKKVYLFFVITPPEATVERAWIRGLETGRYKAVDDLLFHNVEAYTGMPDLFFSWAIRQGKWVHYEFLDNSVPRDAKPRTIAFGENGNLVVTDIHKLCDIDRFREVNVEARIAEDVLTDNPAPFDRMSFLRRAIRNLARVEVLVPNSNQVLARSVDGQVSVDTSVLPSDLDGRIFGDFSEAKTPLGEYDLACHAERIGA